MRDKNLFLLLSKDSSEKLEIKQDEVVTIKAKILKAVKTPVVDEMASGTDPDNNPLAAEKILLSERQKLENLSEAEKTFSMLEQELEFVKEAETVLTETEEIAEVKDEEKNQNKISEIIISDIPATDIAPDTAEEAIIDTPVAEAPAAEIPAEKISDSATADFESKYVLLPSAPKPPEGDSAISDYLPSDTAAETNSEKLAYSEIVPSAVSKNNYYVQLAAYSDLITAENKLKSINIDYPLMIYYDSDYKIYRLMSGPLKNDEKGAALYNVKNSGFKDAFIRKGE